MSSQPGSSGQLWAALHHRVVNPPPQEQDEDMHLRQDNTGRLQAAAVRTTLLFSGDSLT